MAQKSITKEHFIFTDGPAVPGQKQNVSEECVPIYLETAYNYHQGQDYFKLEELFQKSSTIKRLSLKRRPRVAANNVEKPQSDASPSSLAPLLSASSDDTRLLALSPKTRGRPPLPPPYGSSIDTTKNEGSKTSASPKHPESKPLPATRSLPSPRPNNLIEETLMETLQLLEQEKQTQSHPEPHPRRRLASFGGVSSVGSLSPFTGLGAYNQNNNGNKPTSTGADSALYLGVSHGSRGSTGSLRLSPQSSGRSTPVLGLSPLQHVRDQMVVALQRLKDLEEQVKTIPILQVKISVLQEEKRQLLSQAKNQNNNQDPDDVFRKRSYSMGSSGNFQKVSEVDNSVNMEEGIESIVQQDCTGLTEFRQLTQEMQALERTVKGGRLQAHHNLSQRSLNVRRTRSVAVNTDDIIMFKPTKVHKCLDSELIEAKSIATGVSEVDLGIVTEWEVELEAHQQIIESFKDRIGQLEAELKETAFQAEMSRLKLELKAAESRNRVDKASTAKPTTDSKGTEARADTKSQAVGNHIESRDASTGERNNPQGCTVGVSCTAQLRSVSVGPDIPMSHWVVKERVENRDQCVGIQVNTNTQGVGTMMKMCDAEINTDIIGEIWGVGTDQIEYCSLAFSNCANDMTDATDPIRTVDLDVMLSPQAASRRTNTVSSSVSRFTNTRHAFNTNSSTNTIISTQEKHTNTTQTFTRTASVGNKIRDRQSVPETRSIGIGTVAWGGSALKSTPFSLVKTTTRNTGVGFTNIHDNFLIGLKTRNMACGPSQLPDPIRTRSIGVGEGKIRNLSIASQITCQVQQHSDQPQWEPELNPYIEKMQRMLNEQQGLLTASCSDLRNVFDLGNCEDTGSKQKCMNTATAQGGTSLASQPQSPANVHIQSPSQLLNDPCRGDKANSGVCHMSCNDAGVVKRKIQMMEQHASSALQDRPVNSHLVRSIMKKEHSEKVCSNNRKSLVKVIDLTRGLEPVSVHELSACREMKEKEHKWNRTWKDISGVSDKGEIQTGKSIAIYSQDLRGYATPDTQPRFKLNEKMFLACQALKTQLSDEKALSCRDLHACLHTLQQEWFYVSSQKSADPAAVEAYLSAFRAISPLVLQYVLNMADGNGNTVLHYSVSHSNFSIVKKILASEVCNVNHQNKAGYTPIMLAALAAVETPEDMRVVKELFTKGDVNAKASQAGQTALMLAVSHGRMDMVRALLAQGAEVNLRDDEGSTALMCASEHGHTDIVNLLLAQPDCDPTLSDSDESTALSIALEAGHNDIALLLYAHANFYKGLAGGSRLGGK